MRIDRSFGISPVFLGLLLSVSPAVSQEPEGWEQRIAEADSALRACSGDCRFEQARSLRLKFQRDVEVSDETAFALRMAIAGGSDLYWVEAFVTVLDPLPAEARWIRSYWLERADDDGRLPSELRGDLVVEVKRLTLARRESCRRLIEEYSSLAIVLGLDPKLVVHDPFASLEQWLDGA